MRFQEIVEAKSKNVNTAVAARLWTAPVQIKQPGYVGRIDVTVTAPTMQLARQLMRAQYGVPDWQIGSTTEVR
jgi:hypothetical protein